MLEITDDINDTDLSENAILVSFDIVNMFPSIDNAKGIEVVRSALNLRNALKPSAECIIEGLTICLEVKTYVRSMEQPLELPIRARMQISQYQSSMMQYLKLCQQNTKISNTLDGIGTIACLFGTVQRKSCNFFSIF